MINTNLLKGKIMAAGYTQESLAREMGISKNTMSAKVNGKSLYVDEAEKMCYILGINEPYERAQIFLGVPSQ